VRHHDLHSNHISVNRNGAVVLSTLPAMQNSQLFDKY
jgi:hypothetical protein